MWKVASATCDDAVPQMNMCYQRQREWKSRVGLRKIYHGVRQHCRPPTLALVLVAVPSYAVKVARVQQYMCSVEVSRPSKA